MPKQIAKAKKIKKSYLLLKVVQLIIGYLRTPKIEALHRLITRLNSKHNTNITLLGLDTTPLNYSTWLFGIIDAVGIFNLIRKLRYANRNYLLLKTFSKTKLH